MSKHDKLLIKILRGSADSNIPFASLCSLLMAFGFDERIRGDHHNFTKNGIDEILNLQPLGSKSKAYQVKQVRKIILKYQLNLGVDDE
ncbi:MAG: type II toxin-antitoxin system HicA family toxin [Thermodesulfobacteriota bacterium]|nr:type II toxin-antitoxin system HicA family toxin [Thermodesulfobacteriota bacterium]